MSGDDYDEFEVPTAWTNAPTKEEEKDPFDLDDLDALMDDLEGPTSATATVAQPGQLKFILSKKNGGGVEGFVVNVHNTVVSFNRPKLSFTLVPEAVMDFAMPSTPSKAVAEVTLAAGEQEKILDSEFRTMGARLNLIHEVGEKKHKHSYTCHPSKKTTLNVVVEALDLKASIEL